MVDELIIDIVSTFEYVFPIFVTILGMRFAFKFFKSIICIDKDNIDISESKIDIIEHKEYEAENIGFNQWM